MTLEIGRNQRLQYARDVASKGGTVTLISRHCDSHHRNGDRGPNDPLDHAVFGMLWKQIGRVGQSDRKAFILFNPMLLCLFITLSPPNERK